jgi:hypothetical protein
MQGRPFGVRDEALVAVADGFLDWAQQNNAPRTFRSYPLQSNVLTIPRFMEAPRAGSWCAQSQEDGIKLANHTCPGQFDPRGAFADASCLPC